MRILGGGYPIPRAVWGRTMVDKVVFGTRAMNKKINTAGGNTGRKGILRGRRKSSNGKNTVR